MNNGTGRLSLGNVDFGGPLEGNHRGHSNSHSPFLLIAHAFVGV